jgi:CheY-like chemotaxis protein
MRTLLEHWGCEVILAVSEEDALRTIRLAGGAPDAIIADYRLRDGRTGGQAIERIQSEFAARYCAHRDRRCRGRAPAAGCGRRRQLALAGAASHARVHAQRPQAEAHV